MTGNWGGGGPWLVWYVSIEGYMCRVSGRPRKGSIRTSVIQSEIRCKSMVLRLHLTCSVLPFGVRVDKKHSNQQIHICTYEALC